MMKPMRNERGSTLVVYTVAMVAMMGMAALAIDLGFSPEGACRSAARRRNAAALAGASAIVNWNVSAAAKIDRGRATDPRLQTDEHQLHERCQVRHRRRGNHGMGDSRQRESSRQSARRAAVPTWLEGPRVFGVSNSLPVGAKAAAGA